MVGRFWHSAMGAVWLLNGYVMRSQCTLQDTLCISILLTSSESVWEGEKHTSSLLFKACIASGIEALGNLVINGSIHNVMHMPKCFGIYNLAADHEI